MSESQNSTTIVGIDIPFWDLVWLFVKGTFALIPALIVIAIIGAILSGVLGGFFAAMS